MNAPLLILPALAATLALSATKTLPAELRHDAKGKTPLTIAKMAVARGAGSTCRIGCNEPNTDCQVEYFVQEPLPPDTVQRVWGQDWSPHPECGFSMGSDTCSSKKDVLCNVVYEYPVTAPTCQAPATSITRTYTSLCPIQMSRAIR